MKTTTENITAQIAVSETRLPKLAAAVLAEVNRETLEDVCRHGANGGFPGFTYYRDTVAFFDANRADIMRLAKELASELSEDALEMIAGFNCLRADKLTATDICEALHGETENTDSVKNALAWFALEEVARELCPDV